MKTAPIQAKEAWLTVSALTPILQRMPGVALILCTALSGIGPVYFPTIYCAYLLVLNGLFCANNIRAAYGVWWCWKQSVEQRIGVWRLKWDEIPPQASLHLG